jgi:hypothetical protein
MKLQNYQGVATREAAFVRIMPDGEERLVFGERPSAFHNNGLAKGRFWRKAAFHTQTRSRGR